MEGNGIGDCIIWLPWEAKGVAPLTGRAKKRCWELHVYETTGLVENSFKKTRKQREKKND